MIKMNFQSIGHSQTIQRYNPTPIVQPRSIQISPPPPESDYVKPETTKITWGEPTWFLFHTLAEKVKENAFHIVGKELLNIIFLICTNLPCPDCANHATRYLQGINFDAITTKKSLKDLLFNFHNSVNSRKGYSLFPIDQLDGKYRSAITVNIVKNFYYNYDKSTNNQKMAANSFHRSRTISRMKSWLSTNLCYFDM